MSEELLIQIEEFLKSENIAFTQNDDSFAITLPDSEKTACTITINEEDEVVLSTTIDGEQKTTSFDKDFNFEEFKKQVQSLMPVTEVIEEETEEVETTTGEVKGSEEIEETEETKKTENPDFTIDSPTNPDNQHIVIYNDINSYFELFENETFEPNHTYVLLTVEESAFKFSVDKDGNTKFEMPAKTIPKNLETESLKMGEKSKEEMLEVYTKNMPKAKIDENTGKYVYQEVSKDVFDAFLTSAQKITEMHADVSVERMQIDEFKKSAHFILNSKELDNLQIGETVNINNGNLTITFGKIDANGFLVTGSNGEQIIEPTVFDIDNKENAFEFLSKGFAHIDFANISDNIPIYQEGTPVSPDDERSGTYSVYYGHEGVGSEHADVLNYMQRKKMAAEIQLDILDAKKEQILDRLDGDKGFFRKLLARIFRQVSILVKGILNIPLTPEQETLKQIKDAEKDAVIDISNYEKNMKRHQKIYGLHVVEMNQLSPEENELEAENIEQDDSERTPQQEIATVTDAPVQENDEKPQQKPSQPKNTYPQFTAGDSVLDGKPVHAEVIKNVSEMPRGKQIEYFFNTIANDYQIEIEKPNQETHESVVTVSNGDKSIQLSYNPGRNQLNVPPLDEAEKSLFDIDAIKNHLTVANMYYVEHQNEKGNKPMFAPKYIEKISGKNPKQNLIQTLEKGGTFPIKNGCHQIELSSKSAGIIDMTTTIGGITKTYQFHASKDVEDVMKSVAYYQKNAISSVFKSETRDAFIQHIQGSPVLNDNESIKLSDFTKNGEYDINFNVTIGGNTYNATFSILSHSAKLTDEIESETERRIVGNLFKNLEKSYAHCCLNEFQLPFSDFAVPAQTFGLELMSSIEKITSSTLEIGQQETFYLHGLNYTIERGENNSFALTVKSKEFEELHQETLYVAPEYQTVSNELIKTCYGNTLLAYANNAQTYMNNLVKRKDELMYNAEIENAQNSYTQNTPPHAGRPGKAERDGNGELEHSMLMDYFDDKNENNSFSHDDDNACL